MDSASRSTLDPDAAERELECVHELRDELRRGYPRVRRARLRRILRRHGRTSFPESLMMPGYGDAGALRTGLRFARALAARRPPPARSHPLFSARFYAGVNADVAVAGVDPWLHYQVFGRLEERSPHPLIDVRALSAALPGVRAVDVLDEYLARREYWITDPGPYVDVRRFAIGGPWDGTVHPLIQLLRGGPREPWVRQRLRLIDAPAAVTDAYLVAVGMLTDRLEGRTRLSAFRVWSRAPLVEQVPPAPGILTVVPGYFLGARDRELAAGPAAYSPDGTMLRLAEIVVGVDTDTGPLGAPAGRLVYLAVPLDREELETLAAEAREGALIAPRDRPQEVALLRYGAPRDRVLEPGRRVEVEASGWAVPDAVGAVIPASPSADHTGVSADRTGVVLPEADAAALELDPRLTELVKGGAQVILVGVAGILPWLTVLDRCARVIVDARLSDEVRAFVPRRALETWGSR